MENDSPNLFDSEPTSIKLSVTENSDDVLDEILEQVPTNVENIDNDQIQDTEDYQTDESDDPGVDDRLANDTIDQSTEYKTKTKDVQKGLPPGRVKLIMKMDPDVNNIAGEAVFLITKATEKFVGLLAQHCHTKMVSTNKKTLHRKHIDKVIEENVPFEFLEEALDW